MVGGQVNPVISVIIDNNNNDNNNNDNNNYNNNDNNSNINISFHVNSARLLKEGVIIDQ